MHKTYEVTENLLGLSALILGWAEDRNLLKGSSPAAQSLKLLEEAGEVVSGVSKQKPEAIRDGIGDVFVVATIIAKQLGLDAVGLLATASADSLKSIQAELAGADSLMVRLALAASVNRNCLDICASCYRNEEMEHLAILAQDLTALLHNLVVVSTYYNMTLEECVAAAWDEIKDRTGRMVDGVFVKSADL